MLITKHYFLEDAKRSRLEETIFNKKDGIDKDIVYVMDDQELIKLYDSYLMEQ